MARIVLEPRFYEIGPFREQYEGLEKELEAAGHSVTFKYEEERRGAGAAIAQTAWDVAVHILDAADEEIIGAIVVYLVGRLKGKAILGGNRGSRRRAFIYDANGRVLRDVELPDDLRDESEAPPLP